MTIAISKMQRMLELECDFWNDSCDLNELAEAVEAGATGATSNPVIVSQVVRGEPTHWLAMLDRLVRERTAATEDELAWALVEEMARAAAALLAPVHAQTGGTKGFLSVQVNPQYYRSAPRMIEHGHRLASLAPNIAIKIPATEAGLEAIEGLTAAGVRVNATVCFTVSQAVACAEAIERGLERRQTAGSPAALGQPTITIMVGRLDDHLKRILDRDGTTIDPGACNWAGIAVFKAAHALFVSRGYRSTLLAAAYRHHLHWSELIGPDVILTMPYVWWKRFDGSAIVPERTLDKPVEPRIVAALERAFPDFGRAILEGAIPPAEFVRYGATVHTLQQFLAGYQQLLELVRARMLG